MVGIFYLAARSVFGKPGHEMTLHPRTLSFVLRLALTGALFCLIAARISASANAGPISWNIKNIALVSADPFTWTGFYIGAHVGGVWSDYDVGSYDTAFNVSQEFFGVRNAFGPGTDSIVFFRAPAREFGSDDSIIGGGQIGYNFQFGNFVVGTEADFSGLNTGRTASFTDSAVVPFFFQNVSSSTELETQRAVETNWTGSARLRLGYASGPVMLYVTGGMAFAEVNVKEFDRASTTFFRPRFSEGDAPNVFIPPGFTAFRTDVSRNIDHDDSVQFGWTGGAGIEWAPHNNWSIGIEYRHSGFGDETYHFSAHRGPIYPLSGTQVDLDNDQVTLRVNVLLGHIIGH
jgi:outer membrane immunogenic protein